MGHGPPPKETKHSLRELATRNCEEVPESRGLAIIQPEPRAHADRTVNLSELHIELIAKQTSEDERVMIAIA